jgi:hypothetical protein
MNSIYEIFKSQTTSKQYKDAYYKIVKKIEKRDLFTDEDFEKEEFEIKIYDKNKIYTKSVNKILNLLSIFTN